MEANAVSNVVPFVNREIRVLSTRANPTKPNSAVVCYVDVAIGAVSIFGISVLRNKTGSGFWVGLPATFGKTGKIFPIVSIDEPLRAELIRVVLDSCKQYGVTS